MITKEDLNNEITLRFGFNPDKNSSYGISSWKKQNLFALRKIFSITNMRVNNTVTQCCLTKEEMAFQLNQAYSQYGLVFTPHEIHYIHRNGFIRLYNNLIEGVK